MQNKATTTIKVGRKENLTGKKDFRKEVHPKDSWAVRLPGGNCAWNWLSVIFLTRGVHEYLMVGGLSHYLCLCLNFTGFLLSLHISLTGEEFEKFGYLTAHAQYEPGCLIRIDCSISLL